MSSERKPAPLDAERAIEPRPQHGETAATRRRPQPRPRGERGGQHHHRRRPAQENAVPADHTQLGEAAEARPAHRVERGGGAGGGGGDAARHRSHGERDRLVFGVAVGHQLLDPLDGVDAIVDTEPEQDRREERREERQMTGHHRDRAHGHRGSREHRGDGGERSSQLAKAQHEHGGDQHQAEDREPRDVALDHVAVVEGVDRQPGEPGLDPEVAEARHRDRLAHALDHRRDGLRPRPRVVGLHEREGHAVIEREDEGIEPQLVERLPVEIEAVHHRPDAGRLAQRSAQSIDRRRERLLVAPFEHHYQQVWRPELRREVEEAAHLGEIGVDQVEVRRVELDARGAQCEASE
jgi:hypothetical protein